jgi:hypothetical protein
VQLGGDDHGFLEEGDVVVEADGFDEVRLALVPVLEVLLDDLFEAVDVELLVEGRLQPGGLRELLVGPLPVLHLLQVEKGVAEPQLRAVRELLEPRREHPVDLLQELPAERVHAFRPALLLLFVVPEGAVGLVAELLVPLDVADEEGGVGPVLGAVADELEHEGDVGL